MSNRKLCHQLLGVLARLSNFHVSQIDLYDDTSFTYSPVESLLLFCAILLDFGSQRIRCLLMLVTGLLIDLKRIHEIRHEMIVKGFMIYQ